MVRLKTRYILFEIIYPERKTYPIEDNFGTVADSALSIHQPTDSKVTGRQIIYLIRLSLHKNFGDYGSSTAVGLSMRYFSPRTGTGILRVTRNNWKYIVAAITFINSINGEHCVFHTINVSGSIKKCEDRSMQYSNDLIRTLRKARNAADDDDGASILGRVFAEDMNKDGQGVSMNDNRVQKQ
ncbi:hypothetical protein HII13_000035 [Brettanomyces bruxellensis]|uniref:DEBR0S4_10990g1_1 n=1 Tax=Dekkera bruxellensis TaxID=5007 RepID=A0A3F2Y6X4_DEKBR|nr:hypothetical protein HII12_005343 [Brettanomyces bruxellensis]KAF6015101.1 hypothetical protein HII13_000035 [Brettanomyces bruxellensis]VUG19119.1 POP5 [Brettanomyces bruxellensis]